jgi:Zn-dependent M28 family amino/carboxypeptidase
MQAKGPNMASRGFLRFLPALSLMLLAGAASADVTSDLSGKALADPWAYNFLGDLTSEIGPRMAGSAAAHRAAEWAQKKLKEAGFDEVHLESFPVTGWSRGAEVADVTAPTKQHLAVAALGESVPTPVGGIDADIVLFKSIQSFLDAAPGSLTGKIAVITQRMVRNQNGGGYGAIVGGMRVTGASEAAKRGAVAVLIRSIGTDSHRVPHTGVMQYADDAPKIPAAALSNPDADLLERLAAKGPVKLHLSLASEFHEKAEAVTVVGELKGREHPEQVVLLSGHLDSWDLGTGAIDDGAGVAIAAGAARLIGQLPKRPKRTIRVVMFGAEEIGGASKPYADGQGDEANNIVIAGESDFGARKIYEAALPAGSDAFAKQLSAAVVPLGVNVSRQPSRHGGADLEALGEKGVPFVDFAQNGLDYFDIHHTADDTFDKVDPQELAQNVAVWAAFAWLAADSDATFRNGAAK